MGLDHVKQQMLETADKIKRAAQLYEQTDRELADRIRKSTVPGGRGDAAHDRAQAVGFDTKPEGGPRSPLPDDPTPGMSRGQAADGLKDVNRRIAEHNLDLPVISRLPPGDPRRIDFTIETNQLNAEKRQYLDVLPKQHPPVNIIGPDGAELPGVPPGLCFTIPRRFWKWLDIPSYPWAARN